MTGLTRGTRLQIMLDDSELAAIDDYRFDQRIPSRAAAIRQLLRLGLAAVQEPVQEPKSRRRSSGYGVLMNRDDEDDAAS